MEMQALSVIRLLPDTKEQINEFARLVIDEVEAGNINPLDLYLYLKKAEKSFDIIRDGINEYATEEARKVKGQDYNGAKIEVAETGVRYNYLDCGHSRWRELEEIKQKVIEEQKSIEKLLKGLREDSNLADSTTGEVLRPPIKTGKESIKITLK